ncbi:MAG TPA: AAA family ATPase [Solirubrobacteraceae bacterium]
MLVAGKLRLPATPTRLVQRPRIEGLIAGMVERHPVVLVSATAGAGKTTAVAQAVRFVGRPVAWVTAGDGDVAAGRLLEYLAAAISAHAPAADRVARAALAAGISHDEAAALLAESVGAQRLVLVVDEAERVAPSPDAMAVLDALVRFAPAEMRVVLITRSELPLDVPSLRLAGRAGMVDERDLALTADEVGDALRVLGAADVDPKQALAQTGGWVTGVMFEAWRAGADHSDHDGITDPLHGYLAHNVLGQLSAEERELLLVTSMLGSVTAERARLLGVAGAEARLARLRERHLPATWLGPPLTMRCHPRFREYLLDEFTRTGGERVRDAWRGVGLSAEREGNLEEAVEAFIKAGALAQAAAVAESCIVSIVERLDFDVARRWLAALAEVRPPVAVPFITAELLIATWTDTCADGMAIGDRLLELGKRDEVARSSSLAAALMAVSYAGRARHSDARAVLAAARPSPEIEAAHYLLSIQGDEPQAAEPEVPALTGGPLDVVILRSTYHRGLIARVAEEPHPVSERAIEPWRVLAIQAMGQTERALEHYERAPQRPAMWMAGAELMIDLGRAEDARAVVRSAQASLHPIRDGRLTLRASILEAKVALRCARDTETARRALERVLEDRLGTGLASVREHAETWLGLALLLDRDDAEAARLLRGTVASMTRCGRRLVLPAAAVYLAEAEWRAGDEATANAAADVALQAARFQGSDHILLGALADFPSVAGRRAGSDPATDSPWHRLAQLVRSCGDGERILVRVRAPVTVDVREFGSTELVVDSCTMHPRLSKAHTLLALLATRAEREAPRKATICELFDSGNEQSMVSYLRLAVRSARETLPPGVELTLDRQVLRCTPRDCLSSESVRFETLVENARRVAGEQRLRTFLSALELQRTGPYLERETCPWALERRRDLEDLAEEALVQASETAYELAEYAEAERLVRDGLARNRFREPAWRLLMRIAAATRDHDAVIAAYRECESVVAEMGAKPSPATASLLAQLRV